MVAENGTGGGAGADGVSTTQPNPSYVSRDELLSLRVVAGTKRIFIALAENDRGRYLKVSDGRSKLTVPGPGIPDFRAAIDSLFEYSSNNPTEARESTETAAASSSSSGGRRIPDPLHSERFISEGKKFYLDLLCNDRGQYVKVSQATTRRISMILPVAALRHLRDAMTQIDRLAPPDPAVLNPSPIGHTTRSVDRQVSLQDETTVVTKAVQRELRVEGKRIVFESGANRRGSYLRISDNTSSTKSHVIVPHSCVSAIIKLLEEVQDSEDPLNDLRAAQASAEVDDQ